MTSILVTGGAGYIGSHAVLRLLRDGHRVTVIDDLSRGHRAAIDRLAPLGDLQFVPASVGDRDTVTEALRTRHVEVVMHFAAFAAVGESVARPLVYYRRNTADTLVLLEAMEAAGAATLVLSSTCATYGEPGPQDVPIGEACPQQPINPYGRSKLMVEHMVRDYADAKQAAGEPFAFAALRYFNVAGADPAGLIGEDHDPETHLIPICLEAAIGQRPAVTIFGTDYPTPDGTCIRDYVHVHDLVDAHVAVMEALRPGDARAYNVGTGRGHSVREVIDLCRAITGVAFEVREGARRAGDPPALYNDLRRLAAELGWRTRETDLAAAIETAWHWKRKHPNGYRSNVSPSPGEPAAVPPRA